MSVRSCSGEAALKKILSNIRIFGMLPIDEHCHPQPKMIAASAIMIVFLLMNAIYWTFTKATWLYEYGLYHTYLHIFRKVLETITINVIVLQFLKKRDRLRAITYNLRTMEVTLSAVGQEWEWNPHPKKYITVALLLIFVMAFQSLSWDPMWMIIHIEQILAAIFISQLCLFNDMMVYCLTKILSIEEYTLYPKLHDLVQSSCELFNDTTGLGVLFVLSLYFLTWLHFVYQFLNLPDITYMRIVDLISGIVYTSAMILLTIFSCSRLYSEARKFNTELFNMLMQCNDQELYNYEEIFFHFEHSKEFEFTANGFFPVNKKLICSMIITATTYLVILLEYSPSGGPTENTVKNI